MVMGSLFSFNGKILKRGSWNKTYTIHQDFGYNPFWTLPMIMNNDIIT